MKDYVLDASALFAFLLRKPASKVVNELLKQAMRGHGQVSMSAVNYGEIYGSILWQYGHDRAAAAMNIVNPLPIVIVDVTTQRALRAAEVKN